MKKITLFMLTVILSVKMMAYEQGNTAEIGKHVKLSVNSARASEFQPDETSKTYRIENTYDGTTKTIYHSRFGGKTVFPVTLEYFFKDPEKVDYIIYYPREDGSMNWGNFKQFELWTLSGTDTEYKKQGDYDFKGVSTPSVIEFKTTLQQVKSFRFVVKSGINVRVSCGEMEFWSIPDLQAPEVFTDATCSELKSTVTLADIEAMSGTFYKNLAQALFNKQYPAEFRVQEYKPYSHPDTQAELNKTRPHSLLDNPTGMFVNADEELVVFVGETNGQSLSLLCIDYDQGFSNQTTYVLKEGANNIKMSQCGLLYILYHTEDDSARPVKINIATGTVNGYFDSARHNEDDWARLLGGAGKYFDLVGERAHICYLTQSFKDYTTNGKSLIAIYDYIVWQEQEIAGFHKYNRSGKNRMFFHVIHDAYMYASNYRTAFKYTTANFILSEEKMQTRYWGPCHEVGHMHQTPGLKWVGMTEVSVNLYTMTVQSAWKKSSRLAEEYEYGFNDIIGSGMAHSTYVTDRAQDNSREVRLIPLWQLQLYYARVKDNADFYKDLHEHFRTQLAAANNHGAEQINFVKACSDLVKEDLTEFFTAWGFLKPVNATINDYGNKTFRLTQAEIDGVIAHMSQYDQPQHPIQYIREPLIDLYRSNTAMTKGKIELKNNIFTVNDEWVNVVAFEVCEDDKLINASHKNSFSISNEVTNAVVYAVGVDGSRVLAGEFSNERIAGSYDGGPYTLPGKVEGEHYNTGGSGLSYYDIDAGNNDQAKSFRSEDDVDFGNCTDTGGGIHVSYIRDNEYLKYTVNVTEEGVYDFHFRVASGRNDATSGLAGTIKLTANGLTIDKSVGFEMTDGWQTWITKTISDVTLPAGEHTIQLSFTAGGGGFSLNYFEVKKSTEVTSSKDLIEPDNKLVIYPNPVKSVMNIANPGGMVNKVCVYNSIGVKVLEWGSIEKTPVEIAVDVSQLSKGKYIVQIFEDDKIKSGSFVKVE